MKNWSEARGSERGSIDIGHSSRPRDVQTRVSRSSTSLTQQIPAGASFPGDKACVVCAAGLLALCLTAICCTQPRSAPPPPPPPPPPPLPPPLLLLLLASTRPTKPELSSSTKCARRRGLPVESSISCCLL